MTGFMALASANPETEGRRLGRGGMRGFDDASGRERLRSAGRVVAGVLLDGGRDTVDIFEKLGSQ